MTSHNNIKKIKKELVLSFKKFPTTCMNLPNHGERIVAVTSVEKGDHLGVITTKGMGLIFDQADIRAMGKTAGGVKAIDLADGDRIAHMFKYTDEPFILIYAKEQAKLLNVSDDLRIRKRGRRGDSRANLKKAQTLV
jgi:DNA gyrase/topoisomerase IV subunit A